MVWKLFMLVLFWELTGIAVYWAYIYRFYVKIRRLDPNDDELIYEALEMMTCGIFDAKKRDRESDMERLKRIVKQGESLNGEPALLTHLKSYFIWPKMLALTIPLINECYTIIKSEYDRGIRTRKEGPVSQ